MDYITIKEASEKWGVSTRAITYHVVAGRIEGAIKKGNLWLLPMSTEKPADLRFTINKGMMNDETHGGGATTV